MSDETVNVRLPDGTAGTVPKAQVSALPEGTRKMSAAEVEAEKKAIALDKKYELREGNIGRALANQGVAGVAGAARGASLGLSDYLASEFGGSDYLRELKEAFPTTSLAGEAAGMVGVAAATGGAAAAGESALAARLGGGALGRVGAAAARGFAEGAAQGVGSAISESSLNNTGLTAEALIAGGLKGGALGALAGGGVSALGEGVSAGIGALRAPKPTAQAYESLAGGAYRTPAPGVGQALKSEVDDIGRGAARATAEDVGPTVEVSIGPAKQSASLADKAADAITANPLVSAEEKSALKTVWERRNTVLRNEAEALENATRGFAKSLDDEIAAGRKVDMQSFGDAKASQMSRLVDQAKFAEQAEAAINWMTEANAVVSNISKDATAGMGPSAVKQWNGYMQKLTNALEKGNAVELHTTFDNLKRWVGKEAGFGKGPFGLSVAQKEFDALYQGESGLMKLLESDVWGAKAAAAQKEINSATAQFLSEGDLFRKRFTTQFGSEAGRPLYRADPAAVSSHMGRVTDAAADLESEGVRSYIDSRRRMYEALEKNYTFDASTSARLQEAKASLDRMSKTYETTVNDATLTNQVKKALESERARSIGGVAGLLADTATKPFTTMQRLASLEQQTQNVMVKITGGTRKLLAEAEPGAFGVRSAGGLAPPKRTGPGFFSGLLDSVRPVRDASRTAATMGTAKLRAEYERRAEQVNRLRTDPGALANRIGAALGDNATVAPKVTAAAQATAVRGMEFLASKLPHSREDPYSPQPHLEKPRASDAEMAQFRRYVEAVDDPTMVFEAAQKGTLTRDHVEAVKAVYPSLYEQMQVQVMESLASSKSPLSYKKRIQLGILLDLPTDKTLSPDFQKAIQGTYQASGAGDAESPPPTLSRPINVADSLQTATQSASGGAE